MPTDRILVIVTSTDEYEKVGYRTGLWFSELSHFGDVVEEAGFSFDIASPLGGKVPLDPESLLMTELGDAIGLKGAVAKRYADRAYMDRLSSALRIDDVESEDYVAIYLTGGHGVMFDFPDHRGLQRLIAEFHDQGKIVSAVCHGPGGLINVELADGGFLIDGKQVTGYSWSEEKKAKRDHAVPFSLEDRLQERGGRYSVARLPFASHVVTDGRLITGQNPASAKAVGHAVVQALTTANV
jgi:putative intracellular protease/amidase